MKNILFILVFCATLGANVKAQFVPDFEFYLYITDAMGNRDSVLVGYADNDTMTRAVWGINYSNAAFNEYARNAYYRVGWYVFRICKQLA